MKVITKYIDYLKDNPEGYWFKSKLYGWGWVPATREGWLTTIIYLVVVIVLAFRLEAVGEEEVLRQFVVPFLLTLLVFLWIAWRKGEPLKWQWGRKKDGS